MIDSPGHGPDAEEENEPYIQAIARNDPKDWDQYALGLMQNGGVRQEHLDIAIATNRLAIAQRILDTTELSPNHYDGTKPTPIARCLKCLPSFERASPEDMKAVCGRIMQFIEKNGVNVNLGVSHEHDFLEAVKKLTASIIEKISDLPESEQNNDQLASLGHIQSMSTRVSELEGHYIQDYLQADTSADKLRIMSILGRDYAACVAPDSCKGSEVHALQVVEKSLPWIRRELTPMWEAYRETQEALEKPEEPDWRIEKPVADDRVAPPKGTQR